MKYFFIPITVAACLTHATHLATDKALPQISKRVPKTYPSLPALELLSLNYKEIVADYYWINSILHYGKQEMQAYNYPNLKPLLERVLYLDPHFETAYFFAGLSLTNGANLDAGIRLLETGTQYRPNSVKIPFLLGFNYYYYLHDFKTAAEKLSIAAQRPDSPPSMVLLSTRLAAETDDPSTGIVLINKLLPDISDTELRTTYLKRRKLLELEIGLRTLQQDIDKYQKIFQTAPKTLQDLRTENILSLETKHDPIGGVYFINSNGMAATTSEKQRLEPYLKKKRKR